MATNNFRESKSTTNNVGTKHVKMCAPTITAKKVIAMVGVLSSLHPRSNRTHVNRLERDLDEKLSTVALYQSTDKGYGSIVDDPTI